MTIYRDILAELSRAIEKFPTWPTDPIHAVAVIAEEVGELQKSVLESVYEPYKGSREEIRAEAVQAAAMLIRFLYSFDGKRYEYYRSKQHEQDMIQTGEA